MRKNITTMIYWAPSFSQQNWHPVFKAVNWDKF